MTRRERYLVLTSCLFALGLYAAISGFRPWVAPDTPGYLAIAVADEPWAGMRHPLFGWLWAPFFSSGQLRLSVGVQVLVFLGSVIGLYAALRRLGVSVTGGAAVAVALLGSNSALIWHNAIHPELLSTAMILAALAAVLAAVEGRGWWAVAVYGLCLGAGILLRPIFLPAILVFPLLVPVLRRVRDGRWSAGLMVAILLAGVVPVAAQAGYRAARVGDFNIVSFGGFQMAGMAGLMLSPAIVERLPAEQQALARRIIEVRSTAEQAGRVLATPLNSTGQRSFPSAAVGYFDIYARTYDALLWEEIAPLRGMESWVAFNRTLMRLSVATIVAAPVEYAAWVAGATARMAGRATVTNLVFMLGLAGLLGAIGVSMLLDRRFPALGLGDGGVLVPVVVAYTVAAGALGVATSFPAARYIDTAALLLPVLTISPALAAWRQVLARRRGD